MVEELKESGLVTSLATIGLVAGGIGMFGSFIPCLGIFAMYAAIPASLVSGLAVFIAYSNNAKRTLAIIALTISLIGTAVSVYQYQSMKSATRKLEQYNRSRR